MKGSSLEHKGYKGSIEYDIEAGLLHGKIQFIRDIITYAASTIPDLNAEFIKSVDEYLDDCKVLGREPNKPYSGTFNVRVGCERHKNLALSAFDNGQTLNDYICSIIDHDLANRPHNHIHLHVHGKADLPYSREQSKPRLPHELTQKPMSLEYTTH
jgi:predicted HicB family RNase H-like nuclease